MKVEYHIARRLNFGRSGGGSSRNAVVIAVTGVALSLTVMLLTLGIVLGFKRGIREHITAFEAPLAVEPHYVDASGATASNIVLTRQLARTIYETFPGADITEAIRCPVILKTPEDFYAAVLTGYSRSQLMLHPTITAGVWPDFDADSTRNQLVISSLMADFLQVAPGDKIDGAFFTNDQLRNRRFTISGVYTSNFEEYDGTVAFANFEQLQSVTGYDSLRSSAVLICPNPPITIEQVPAAADSLYNRLLAGYYAGESPYIYPVTSIVQKGAVYFNWLNLLDTNVAVIFILMLCVAAFTLISSLFMIVLERIPTIGILRALGCTRRRITLLFELTALRLILPGMLIGNVLGLGLMWIQWRYATIHLDPQMYYLDRVPIEFSPGGILLLNLGTLIVSAAALLIPAISASKVDPAVTAKYE